MDISRAEDARANARQALRYRATTFDFQNHIPLALISFLVSFCQCKARRRILGHEHPDTLASVNNLAALLKASAICKLTTSRYGTALLLLCQSTLEEISKLTIGSARSCVRHGNGSCLRCRTSWYLPPKAIAQLPSTKVQYCTPCPAEMARHFAAKLGIEKEMFKKKVMNLEVPRVRLHSQVLELLLRRLELLSSNAS